MPRHVVMVFVTLMKLPKHAEIVIIILYAEMVLAKWVKIVIA
jgi:hypothetical protein